MLTPSIDVEGEIDITSATGSYEGWFLPVADTNITVGTQGRLNMISRPDFYEIEVIEVRHDKIRFRTFP